MSSTENNLSFLKKEPVQLRFGTSGLRGLVVNMTDLECYINTAGFIEYLIKIGNIQRGDTVCIAGDLRTSTRRIMTAVAAAIEHSECKVDNCGLIPTPAVTYYAMQKGEASIMVTGSHIPNDRNGIKFNRNDGEVLEADEAGILAQASQVRRMEYFKSPDVTLFKSNAMLKKSPPLPDVDLEAGETYVRRYLSCFPVTFFSGKTIIVYQHSAVGRDTLIRVLKGLGSKVIHVKRSQRFVPIDTENITNQDKELFRALAERYKRRGIFAVVSTDGDSDRPFVADENGEVYRGDVLGIIVCQYLKAQFAAVPVSSSDAVTRQLNKDGVALQLTKIGSPYVIAAMNEAIARGKSSVVGWEVNGGFLTGTDFSINGNTLKALPTRDALLPILCALAQAAERNVPVSKLFSELPQRYTDSGVLDNFPQESGRQIIKHFLPPEESKIRQVTFEVDVMETIDAAEETRMLDSENQLFKILLNSKIELEGFFSSTVGFGSILSINFVDGIRITFANGDTAHLRPSGNAPQFRAYSSANNPERAAEIVRICLADPDGVVLKMREKISITQ